MSGYSSEEAGYHRGRRPKAQPQQHLHWTEQLHTDVPNGYSIPNNYTHVPLSSEACDSMDLDDLPMSGLNHPPEWEYTSPMQYHGQTSMVPSTNSFLSVRNTSSTMNMVSEPATNDWTNLHRRSYSEASNRISDTHSDDFLSSVHGSSQGIPEGWEPGADYAVETVEDAMYMSHSQGAVLTDMSAPAQQNNHQYVTAGGNTFGDQSIYQARIPQFQYHAPEPHRHDAIPIQISRGSSGPWNQYTQKVADFDPGFSAFGPPTPGRDQDNDDASSDYPSTPGSTHSGRSRTAGPASPQNSSKETQPEFDPNWDHSLLTPGGQLQHLPSRAAADAGRRGVRDGHLSPKVAKKAHDVRKMHACWTCWNAKAPCSVDKICKRCSKLVTSLGVQPDCFRHGFDFYAPAWSPDLFSHLQQPAVELLVKNNVRTFTYPIEVGLSTGIVFKPMKLSANMFDTDDPDTNELLRQSYLTAGMPSQLTSTDCAPVGLMSMSTSHMKRECNNHVKEMISNPQYSAQVTCGDATKIPFECLQIVLNYHRAKDSLLLRNVLKLHAIQYFMKSLPTFSSDSDPRIQQNNYISSRLLNRQVKFSMKELQKDVLLAVLKDLQKSMRLKSKDSWGPSFCAMLILCLCMEGVQTAVDVLVVCDNERDPQSKYTRDQSYEACWALEDNPFRHVKNFFHDVYKSHGLKGSLNPLRFMQMGRLSDLKLNKETNAMVKAIYEKICGPWTELVELSDRPHFLNRGGTVRAGEIAYNNNGRLAAKFLRSFFEDMTSS